MGGATSRPIDPVLWPSTTAHTEEHTLLLDPAASQQQPRSHSDTNATSHSSNPDTSETQYMPAGDSNEAPPDLFLPLGPAFFSPLLPTSSSSAWTQHGGSQIPTPPELIIAQSRRYIHTPRATFDNLHNLVLSAAYVFVDPSDPLLHFIRSPDLVLVKPQWIMDCITHNQVLEIREYEVELPSGARAQVGDVQKTLESLVSNLQTSSNRRPPLNDESHQDLKESAALHYPAEKQPSPPLLDRKSAKRRKTRYVLQPYLELVLPPRNTSEPQSHIPQGTRSVIDTRHSATEPYTPILKRRTGVPPTLTRTVGAQPQAQRPGLLSKKYHQLESAANVSYYPLPAGTDLSHLQLPSFDFVLETNIAPGFRLDQLHEHQMAQLLREIVEDASAGMQGDLKLWNVEQGEDGEEEEEVLEEGRLGTEAEAEAEQKFNEKIRLDEEKGVEALLPSTVMPISIRDGGDPIRQRRNRVADRAEPVTPTPARSIKPIRTETSDIGINATNHRGPEDKRRKKLSQVDGKKENRTMGRAPKYTGPGTVSSPLALTAGNLRRQQASMEEEEMLEYIKPEKRRGKRKRGDVATDVGRAGGPTGITGHKIASGLDDDAKRPIWKDPMAERRFEIG